MKTADFVRANSKRMSEKALAEIAGTTISEIQRLKAQTTRAGELGISDALTQIRNALCDLRTHIAPDSTHSGKHLRAVQIIDTVANCFNLTREALQGRRRSADVAHPRMLAAYLIRRIRPDLTLVEIGWLLNRDHTTVLYAIRRAPVLMNLNPDLRDAAQTVIRIYGDDPLHHQPPKKDWDDT